MKINNLKLSQSLSMKESGLQILIEESKQRN